MQGSDLHSTSGGQVKVLICMCALYETCGGNRAWCFATYESLLLPFRGSCELFGLIWKFSEACCTMANARWPLQGHAMSGSIFRFARGNPNAPWKRQRNNIVSRNQPTFRCTTLYETSRTSFGSSCAIVIGILGLLAKMSAQH